MLGLIDRLIGPVSTILDKVVSDKDLKEKLAHDIATMAERHGHDVIKAQIEVNKEEAKHRSLFVSWLASGSRVDLYTGAFVKLYLNPYD